MASLPSPASWRRSSRSEQSSSQAIDTPSSSQAASSSQSFSLNNPQHIEPSAPSAPSAVSAMEAQPAQQPPPAKEDPSGVRRCWICQQDSSDDTPPGQEWRRPCPCSLTAHEECLLEWITSEEAPKTGEIATAKEIVCPQCKAPIKIERPRDPIVLAAGKIQSIAKTLVLPTALSAVVGCFYSGLLVYGVNTIHVVFGASEARRMMIPNNDLSFLTKQTIKATNTVFKLIFKDMDPFIPASVSLPNWQVFIGLPVIAPALILARTTVADQAFAVIPIVYLMFRNTTHFSFASLNEWPPSPGSVFSMLPSVRFLYNEIYKHTFANLEKQWDLAVQRKPREGETQEQVDQERNRADNNALFDLEVELRNELADGDEQWEDLPQDADPWEPPQEIGHVGPLEIGEDVAANPDAAPAPRRRPRENRRGWSTSSIGSTVMGALFFPLISSTMGDILKYTLPARWVGPYTRKGLLTEKWGRTVIGGCLFVVLKDAIVLYCKWKKARDFGKKKVLDYVGKRTSDRDRVIELLGNLPVANTS